VPTEFKDAGVLAGTVYTTVFDETGRPVNRLNRFDVFTQDVFYGIRLTDSYVNTREPCKFRWWPWTATAKPSPARPPACRS
jgi:hypothetical protein